MQNLNTEVGIAEIGVYVPLAHESNIIKKSLFDFDDNFLINKIGIDHTTRKDVDEDTSDLCVKAFDDLLNKVNIEKEQIKCIVVVTQNPDGERIPHTSAILHSKLNLDDDCAAFDISLGCSGFVYGLSIIQSFMTTNHITTGLLFTCDPYSKILNPADKNTSLLFGDAATVTLINNRPRLRSLDFSFGTRGKDGEALVTKNGLLTMDGRAVFNFSAIEVPTQIRTILEKNALTLEEVDVLLLHQGSKFIIDTIARRLGVTNDKVPTNLKNIGNTVSSSIPLLLERYISKSNINNILISGFGVGLSWASAILQRTK